MQILTSALVIQVYAITCIASATDVCLGEFEVCPSGTCVLDTSLCGVCKTAGEFLCPDGSTCVPSAEAVISCPVVTPLFNWTLSLSERVSGTIAVLTLEEKAALIVMVSPVSVHRQVRVCCGHCRPRPVSRRACHASASLRTTTGQRRSTA